MKRISIIISMMLLFGAANAQTYNIHMKSGEVIKYNSSDIDYINFSATGKSERTPEGVEAVDLGLPSGTLWSNMNVGASSPEDYGDYFAWGETTPKVDYDWSNYKWCNGDWDSMKKYCTKTSYGYNGFVDNKTVLDAEDDAAHVNWGGDWRMPTYAECQELFENTTSEWTTQNGVNGRKFTSKTNGNSIFLPAAGCRWDRWLSDVGSNGGFWSSTLIENEPSGAQFPYFGNWGVVEDNGSGRFNGQSVRPVRRK